jgi:hypothetical protein
MSRISLFVAALSLSGVALADGQLEGVVFESATGAPWPNAVLRLKKDAGETVEVPLSSDASFSVSVDAATWTVVATGPNGQALGQWPVRIVDDGVSEVLLTLDVSGGNSSADITEPSNDVQDEQTADLPTFPVQGTIVDERGTALSGASIVVRGQSGRSNVDETGTFTVQAPVGSNALSVMLDGYRARTIEFELGEDGGLSLDPIVMVPAGLALDDYTIRAPRIEGGTSELIQERQSSASVNDVLGAEQMSRAGDSDAASALKRVTGLTVVDGKYVYVRGLGERYSASLLNGATLPSPEPERRVVPLDLFPTKMLESVVIQKTFSPDQPAEFGGGVVSLRTKSVPDGFVANIGMSGTHIDGTTSQNGPWGFQGNRDWLGLGLASRELPKNVMSASSNSPLEETDMFTSSGYTPEELEAFGESMPNHWSVGSRTLPMDFGVNALVGHGMDFDGWKAGVMVSGLWDQDWSRDHYQKNYYLLGEANALEDSHTYVFNEASREVRMGGAAIAAIEVGEHHKIQSTTLLNRSSEGSTRTYEGLNRDVGADIRVTRVRWIERELFVEQLTGTHVFPVVRNLGIDWKYTYSEADRAEPDRREFRYDHESANDTWYLSDRPEGNSLFYSDLGDKNTDMSVGLSLPVTFPWMAEGDGALKAGVGKIERARGVDTRRFKYMHKGDLSGDSAVLSSQPEDIFVPENIGSDGFQFEEVTRETDNYAARQQIDSAYGMANLELHHRFRMMGGYRLETSDQRVETYELFNPDNKPVVAQLKTSDWLPAATATTALGRKSQEEEVLVRFAYGRTLSRPDFRELSPATFNDVTGGRQVYGNPDLKRTLIDNYDARLEWYPTPGESISLGAFAKSFQDPIEKIVVVSAQHSVTYQNAKEARNVGLEFEFRKSLGFTSGHLEDLFFSGNAAWIRSRVKLADNAGIQSSNNRALEGQSPYVINGSISYEPAEGNYGGALLYNVAGKRITEVGALGAPDYVEMPIHRLDAAGYSKLGAGFKLGLKARNILDWPSVTKVGSKTVEENKSGWSVGASLSWSH